MTEDQLKRQPVKKIWKLETEPIKMQPVKNITCWKYNQLKGY